jgi:hypothetical protein
MENRVLIISYDLVDPGQNYEGLLQGIKSYAWARLGGSAYLIYTSDEPVAVRDKLMKLIDKNDKLFVSVVRAPAAWSGMSQDVSDWIRNQLK